jgi:hypothetical protein
MTSGRLDQHHTPLPPERRAFDTQLLDKVAYAYREHCVIAILRDYFNREEQTYRRPAPDQGWPGNDVEAYHKRTNTHLKADTTQLLLLTLCLIMSSTSRITSVRCTPSQS